MMGRSGINHRVVRLGVVVVLFLLLFDTEKWLLFGAERWRWVAMGR